MTALHIKQQMLIEILVSFMETTTNVICVHEVNTRGQFMTLCRGRAGLTLRQNKHVVKSYGIEGQ